MATTIKNSKIWNDLKAKFDVDICVINNKKVVKNIPKWTQIKTDLTTNRDNLGIITGKINGITVIDIDQPKDGEIDGFEYFQQKVCKLEDCKFIVKTISGGYHLYFKYNSKVKSSIKINNQNSKLVSIDVRNDCAIIFGGKGYQIIKDCKFDELTEVPEAFIQLYKKDEKRIKMENTIDTETISDKSIKLILKHLDIKFLNNFRYWHQLLFVLKNIGIDKEKIKEYSSNSDLCKDDFDDYFDDKFDNIEVKEKPNLGTLYYYLKESVNETKYKYILKCIKDNEKNDEDEAIQLDDESCYEMFADMYKDKIITDIDNNIYLCNDCGIWMNIKKNDKRLQDMVFKFNKYLIENNYKYNLNNKKNRGDLKEELVTFLQVIDLQFDKNPYVFAFRNGIVDLQTGIFRKASPKEFINRYVNYDYKLTDTNLIDNYFNDIFNEKDIKEYFINSLSLSLENINRKQEIMFMIGPTACNGKSTTLEMLDDALDSYGSRIPTSILTSKRENSSGANEALMVLKDSRFAYCTEPEHGNKININTVKEITGDKISCRANYGKQETFKVNTSIFLASQYAPELDTIDAGIIRRVRIIPFVNKFVINPDKSNPNEKLIKTFSSDEKEIFKLQLVNLLIQNYKKIYNLNFVYAIPEKVLNITNDYFQDNNELDNFIIDNYEYKENSFIKFEDIKRVLQMQMYSHIKYNDTILKSRFENIFKVSFYKDKTINKKRYLNSFLNLILKEDIEYIEDDLN
jgi:P4 family phage/plasmid primase-like protien